MKQYRIFLCGVPGGPVETPNPECSNAAEHTPAPRGYLEWHEWAEEMAATHEPQECSGCGRWLIHKPLEPAGGVS